MSNITMSAATRLGTARRSPRVIAGGHRALMAVVATLAFVLAPRAAEAQLERLFGGGSPPVVLENVRVITGTGAILDGATVIVRGDEVLAVRRAGAEDGRTPRNAKTVDASGLTLTAGLLDVHGLMGLTGNGGDGPRHRAADAFDRYDDRAIASAHARGVTALYVPARGGAISGTGSVIRLTPVATPLDAGEALHVDLASTAAAVARLGRLDGIRKRFQAAKDYREQIEIYEEDQLPEYEEKLAERAKKKEEDGGKDDGIARSETPRADPPTRRGRPSGRGGGRGGRGGGGGGADAIRKPREPRTDRAAEVLLRAIDGEIPVRVVAHRSADILNAIDLAEEFDLTLIIEGGHEAALVAEELAAADARVVLGPAAEGGPYGGARWRTFDAGTPAALDAAGVDWVVGSGDAGGTRFILQNAMLATSHGSDTDALHRVTRDAAAFLGLPDHGVVRRGAAADLVLWSADPLEAGATVVAVMVAGEVVHGALPE